MENIGFDYGVSKQRISEAVSWVEETLIKSEKFSLPSKRELLKENTTVSIAIVDVTEQETERPKHKQEASYSGEKKRHTIKDQLVINGDTKQIIGIYEEKGAVHDLEIFKRSRVNLLKDILLIGDKGYQGLKLYHFNSLTPYKKPKNGTLADYQKWFNTQISRYRIYIEHINRRIKRFKILQYRYRNKQKKPLLRISLISAIYNYELLF